MKYQKTIAMLLACMMLAAGCSNRQGVQDESSSASQSSSVQESLPPESSQEESSMEQSSSSSQAQSKPQPDSKPTTEPEGDDWKLRLVSAKYPLKAELDMELTQIGNIKVNSKIVESLRAMIADAKKEGYNLNPISGYRTFAKSKSLYESKVQEYKNSGYNEKEALAAAAKWVAPPGTSEHHTGLAVDIITADYYTKLPDLLPEFEEFPEAKWMKEHAHEYGFILRFPKDKESVTGINFEPWHFRYVGKENAKAIYEQGLTLEEYLGK